MIATRMAETAGPWPDALMVDTSGPVEKAVEQALSAIRPAGAAHVWHRRPPMSPD